MVRKVPPLPVGAVCLCRKPLPFIVPLSILTKVVEGPVLALLNGLRKLGLTLLVFEVMLGSNVELYEVEGLI